MYTLDTGRLPALYFPDNQYFLWKAMFRPLPLSSATESHGCASRSSDSDVSDYDFKSRDGVKIKLFNFVLTKIKFHWKQRGRSQTYRLVYKSHGLIVKYRMRMGLMDCTYCDIANANIFDCLEIHGFTPRACIKNTWGHE